MKRAIKYITMTILLLLVGALTAAQLGAFSGNAPQDIGVTQGLLKAPSMTSNSVSSQAGLYPEHQQHDQAQIAPLALRGDGPATLQKIQTIIEATPNAVLVQRQPDYLYAQYTTRMMKFVDDVEFWFDPVNQVIQLRSASRIGREDFGVNRARMESIRAALAATPP
jgi:uncharacterized protein (DUF1499 family)